ncbi:hypothetical protein MRX96_021224 [Rhipicephalus microplus]|uniref:Putative defensin n=1 Tax=Rhipicephalus microplus TaxID=6941 RepID=A0A6G5A1Q4_RHIMP
MAHCLFITVLCLFLLIDKQMGQPNEKDHHELKLGSEQDQRAAFVEERSSHRRLYSCQGEGGKCKERPCGLRPTIKNGTCPPHRHCCNFTAEIDYTM